ncbi:SGNH/GDSL hydrolase family protein [Sphaerothrix gracilis]|uniref:SGNH/GDSL hydrolase family protein n=1 Tax=Sphaerothrix gracilis TaxID=3151835 RepID=UPI0031FDAF8D
MLTMPRKILKTAGFLGLFILAIGELLARFSLGLGSPPLSSPHPTVEYLYQPNQDVFRFGNRFITNQYGMRSELFAEKKKLDSEIRVMVFGDSVLNGGSLTDQDSLATSLLAAAWEKKLNRKVIVGNISAGSWGPGNWLAYAQAYGFFEADVVILLLSSHDAYDNPTFQPLDLNTHPQKAPVSALQEAIARYLPRYFAKITRRPAIVQPSDRDIALATDQGISDLKEFLLLAQQQTPHVFLFLHPTRSEARTGQQENGYEQIYTLSTDLGISTFSLHEAFHNALQQREADPYRSNDNIHPSEAGQKLIADAIQRTIPASILRLSQQRDNSVTE